MNKPLGLAAAALSVFVSLVSGAAGLKEEYRAPWTRNDENFFRRFLVAGAFDCSFEADCLAGGEASVRPREQQEQKGSDGSTSKWRVVSSWGDSFTFDDPQEGRWIYAYRNVPRAAAGRARLSVGAQDDVRAWINGKLVLSHVGPRAWAADTDLVDVDLAQGDNALLIKAAATKAIVVRLLEAGAVLTPLSELAPVIEKSGAQGFSVRTPSGGARAAAAPVRLEVMAPGGAIVAAADGQRGGLVDFDAASWADGPYEVRASTRNFRGRRETAYLPWYKGDALVLARRLGADAAQADAATAAGATLRMLADLVDEKLQRKLADATGNPWERLHAPLMEYSELLLERAGKPGRIHGGGFVRLAWIDDTDGTPQYCRAYLPPDYDPARRWPMMLHLHGYNPPNPVYVKWWGVDARHSGPLVEPEGQRNLIYVEPHGRGNTQYRGFGDADVMRCIAEAKRLLSVDDDRVYLQGESMGGWGTWNVATRHPDTFAAIAPIFGGLDYHSDKTEEQLARMDAFERVQQEAASSWSMADALVNLPIFVHHGDADGAVKVAFSRYGVQLLQRWGYDVRYREYPGKVHETLANSNGLMNVDWFLEHARNANPRKVRIRSVELRNAQAYWASIRQRAHPYEFMTLDAEVVGANTLRVDTQNVLEVLLTPAGGLVDPARPVTVIWNGVARDLEFEAGALRLADPGYRAAPLHKTPQLPGAAWDFYNTPFALVVGTTSKDANVRNVIHQRVDGFVAAWKDWQKYPPRVFDDTAMTDADIARYSLILVGGPGENAVSAKLAAQLPLRLAADSITIGPRKFAVRDAAVQLLYPNPRNSGRYVWMYAGNSPLGLSFSKLSPFNTYPWDFVIDDGRAPAEGVDTMPERTNVVSGLFDYNWRFDAASVYAGDAAIRAAGRTFRLPFGPEPTDAKLLADCAGNYRLREGDNGTFRMYPKDGSMWIDIDSLQEQLWSAGEDVLYSPRFLAWLTCKRGPDGKVNLISGYGGGGGAFHGDRVP